MATLEQVSEILGISRFKLRRLIKEEWFKILMSDVNIYFSVKNTSSKFIAKDKYMLTRGDSQNKNRNIEVK